MYSQKHNLISYKTCFWYCDGVTIQRRQVFFDRLTIGDMEEPERKEIKDFLDNNNNKFYEKAVCNGNIDSATYKNLTKKIVDMVNEGSTTEQMDEAITQRLNEIFIKRLEAALRTRGVKFSSGKSVKYEHLYYHTDSAVRRRLDKFKTLFDKGFGKEYKEKAKQLMEKAARKRANIHQQTHESLQIINPVEKTEVPDFTTENQQTKTWEAILENYTQKTTDASKTHEQQKENYKTRINFVDNMTDPEGGMIVDYDDGWFGEQTDATSYTRARLNGYLYASDIFAGGGKAGQEAVKKNIEKPYQLYSHWDGSRLDMSDLENGMQLGKYFKDVEKYTTFEEKGKRFDKVIGTMAGLLKLADDTISDSDLNNKYTSYLHGEFEKMKSDQNLQNNEEKQLEFLFNLRSFNEFVGANPEWRVNFLNIENLTDPDRSGSDVIDDYPNEGTGKDKNRDNNPVREGLNGYLYAVSLFYGKDTQALSKEYSRAYEMYKDVFGRMFLQEHLDRDPKHPNAKGDDDGFGLGTYINEAKSYSNDITVQYAIAGLLKFTNDMPDNFSKVEYKNFLQEKLNLLRGSNSKEFQLSVLSGLKTSLDNKVMRYEQFVNALIDASKQHNRFVLPTTGYDEKNFSLPNGKSPYDLVKDKLSSFDALKDNDLDILNEVSFISLKTFSVQNSKNTLKALEQKYNYLGRINHSKNIYDDGEMGNLLNRCMGVRNKFDDIQKDLNAFKNGNIYTAFVKAVENRCLEKLFNTEKEAYDILEELDDKIETVQNPEKTDIYGDNYNTESSDDYDDSSMSDNYDETSSSDDYDDTSATDNYEHDNEPEREKGEIETNWENGKLVKFVELFKDYDGDFILTLNPGETYIDARDLEGKPFKINPGVRVKRIKTENFEQRGWFVNGITFAQVIYEGRPIWIKSTQVSLPPKRPV